MRHSIFGRSTFYLCILFAISLPWGQRLPELANNMCIILLALSAFVFWIKQRFVFPKPAATVYAFVIYYIIIVAGLLYTSNHKEGLFVLEKKMALLVLPLSFAALPLLSVQHFRRVMAAFVLSCTMAGLYCLLIAIARNYQEGYTLSYLYRAVVYDSHGANMYPYLNYWYFTNKLLTQPINMHPVYFAMYTIFAALTAYWLWRDGKTLGRLSLWAFLILMFALVVLLASRTQLFLSVLGATILCIYLSWRQGRMVAGLLVVIAIYALAGAIVLNNPVLRERILTSNLPGKHFSENKYGEGGLSLRLHKWKYSVEACASVPLLGAGTGDGQDLLMEVYRKNSFTIGVENNFNPHNQYLQAWLYNGVPGFASLVLCFFLPMIRGFRARQLLLALLCVLVVCSCITESMLEVNKGIAFYSFFAAFLLMNEQRADLSVNTRRK